MKLEVKKYGINGEGIAYTQKQPVFIEGALKDEVVDAHIVRSEGKYKIAKLDKIIKKSEDRQKAICPYYEKCGACQIMHMKYDASVKMKEELILEAFNKYAEIDLELDDFIINERPLNYRNSLKLPIKEFRGKLCSGFYEEGSNKFFANDTCYLHEDGLDRVRKNILNVLNKYHMEAYDPRTRKGIRGLFIRTIKNKYEACIVTGGMDLDKNMVNDLLKIEGLVVLDQSINKGSGKDFFGKQIIHLSPKHYLEFSFMYMKCALSTKAFFQLNTKQAEKLYQTVYDLVDDNTDELFEAYAGIGVMSLLLSKKAKHLVSVESIAEATFAAKLNAKKNKIDNINFVTDDAALCLKNYLKKHKVDTLVVDPPRSGLDDLMLETILKSKIKNIIYVSCNPATLAKNIYLLKDKYNITKAIGFDMFSQTAHVETVIKLERK